VYQVVKNWFISDSYSSKSSTIMCLLSLDWDSSGISLNLFSCIQLNNTMCHFFFSNIRVRRYWCLAHHICQVISILIDKIDLAFGSNYVLNWRPGFCYRYLPNQISILLETKMCISKFGKSIFDVKNKNNLK
jgi:hypothetical protein